MNTIWKDRKRIFGLPITFTKYKIDNSRLYISKGFFTTIEDELVLYRVLDVRLKRTLADKIFGVGTITIYTADETDKVLLVEKVKRPKMVRDMLSESAEQERSKMGIKGRELYGVADNPSEDENNNQ
jgi:uncharacterized membrane protein YdbT with pleckstrin-like domain